MTHFGVIFEAKEHSTDLIKNQHFRAPGVTQLRALGSTPIKVDRLNYYLQFYPNKEDAIILSEGFQQGFRVNYHGPRQAFECSNLVSARQHEAKLAEKIDKEIKEGRVADPFKKNPFQI